MLRAKTNPETTVRVNRLLRAPIHRVYAAWTDKALLTKWWGGDQASTHELILEPEVYGEFHWVYSDTEGNLHTVNGEVRELVRGEKMLLKWIAVEGTPHFDHDDHYERDGRHRHTHHLDASQVNIDFREGQGVEVRILHIDLPDKAARDEMEQLWNASLDRLQKLLAK